MTTKQVHSHAASIATSTTFPLSLLATFFIPQHSHSILSATGISNTSTSAEYSFSSISADVSWYWSLFHKVSLISVHAVWTCFAVTLGYEAWICSTKEPGVLHSRCSRIMSDAPDGISTSSKVCDHHGVEDWSKWCSRHCWESHPTFGMRQWGCCCSQISASPLYLNSLHLGPCCSLISAFVWCLVSTIAMPCTLIELADDL